MVENWQVYLRCRDAFEKSYDETVRLAILNRTSRALWGEALSLPYGIDVWQEAVMKNGVTR